MARKRFPIFDKVSNLLKLSFLKHKLRKPIIIIIIIPKLLLLKKLRKSKEFKLLRHHHHQKPFSPSSSSIRNHFKNTRHRDLRSFFYLDWCLGHLKLEGAGTGSDTWECQVEAQPMRPIEIEDATVAEDLFDSGDELGESVDEKAERFINRFYHEMRMQNRGMDLYI